MDIRQQVQDAIYSFEGFFTVEDIYKKLEEKVDVETNKEEICYAIDDIFECSCSIRQVPFTNKYYILND